MIFCHPVVTSRFHLGRIQVVIQDEISAEFRPIMFVADYQSSSWVELIPDCRLDDYSAIPAFEFLIGWSHGIRSAFKKHVLFYEMLEDDVLMRRAMHGQRDLPRRLLEPPGNS